MLCIFISGGSLVNGVYCIQDTLNMSCILYVLKFLHEISLMIPNFINI